MKDNLKLIVDIKNLNILILDILSSFPNKEKILRDKLTETSFSLLENAYNANIININDKRRKIFQEKLLVNVYMIDHYIRISYHYGYISEKQFRSINNSLTNISKLAKGWINYGESKLQ